jgi:hypothetical protein
VGAAGTSSCQAKVRYIWRAMCAYRRLLMPWVCNMLCTCITNLSHSQEGDVCPSPWLQRVKRGTCTAHVPHVPHASHAYTQKMGAEKQHPLANVGWVVGESTE